MFAPVGVRAYTSGGYVRSFSVGDIRTTELGGNSYKDPIVLDANSGQGGPLLQYWVNDEDFYRQNGYWEKYVLPSCPFTREGYIFSGWKVYDACYVGDEGYTFVDSNGARKYIGGYVGRYGAYDSIDVCGWTALVAQWQEKQASIVFGSKWYEAAADDEGTTLVGWKHFFMGANVAIPVTVTDGDGNTRELTPDDIAIKPGTFVDYGEPYVVTEAEMWNTYGRPMFDVRNAGSRIDLEKDGGVWVYNNWEWEDITGVTYELEKGIWPFFDDMHSDYYDVNDWMDAHSNRQWIVIPTGMRPQAGTHTFTVDVKIGGKTASFPVSFTMNPDQRARAATVCFNANGGTVDEYGRVVDIKAAIGSLPVPERNGYSFKGWYTAKTKGAKVSASTKVTKAMTLYARWVGKTYRVWTSDNGTDDMYAKLSGLGKYATGSKVTVKAAPRNKNWVFDCWDWGFESEDGVSWEKLEENIQNTTLTFTMPPGDVQLVGYCLKKSEDYAPKFKFYGAEDELGTWLVRKDAEELGIYIESQSYAKLNANKSIPAGMKLVKNLSDWSGYQCKYTLKVSDWSKLPKGTVKTVKLTATNRSGRKTTKSFKVVMPNKTQAVDKGALEIDTLPPGYELRAGVKFNWNNLDIAAAEGWKITAITGIPGLTWNAAKQTMAGVPSKAGTYAATFTVAKGKTKYTATATFNVEALPKEIVGTFYGYCTPPKISDRVDDYESDVNPYAFGKNSRKVMVSVASSGKVTAKVGSVTLSGTGLATDENGSYGITLSSSKKYKAYTDVKQLGLAIKPDAGFAEDMLTGIFSYGKVTPMTGALAEEKVFARRNAAVTDAEAKTIASKYAKLGKQSFIVFKAHSGSGYSYDLACPACVMQPSKKAEVFVKIDTNGKTTLSGKIGGVKVSGTSYLSYEYPDEGSDTLNVYARFVIGKFVIEIVGDTEYFYSNGSLNGRVWKK